MVEQKGQRTNEDQIEGTRVEQRPQVGTAEKLFGKLDNFHNGNDTGKGGILDQGDHFVGNGGQDPLDHLLENDLEEDLRLGHAKNLSRLVLTAADALNTAAIDFAEIAGVVDHEGDQGRQKPRRDLYVCSKQIHFQIGDLNVEKHSGNVKDDKELKHQRNASNDPNENLHEITNGTEFCHGSRADDQSQREGKDQGQKE